MKRRVLCWSVALFPSTSFEAVPATTVQQAMRQWFERWGRPEQIQFDHGQPWGSGGNDLPSLFELWLVGLGIQVVWSRPRRPQDNGIVERSHRVTQSWSTPNYCHTLEQLQQHLNQVVHCQRQLYPTRDGLTRLQRYPQLLESTRPYQSDHEDPLWSLQRVYDYLAQGCWRRKVDGSGRISLYNRNYTFSRAHAAQTVWIRFDPTTASWVAIDSNGQQVGQCLALEITSDVIRQLKCHRSVAKHQLQPTATT